MTQLSLNFLSFNLFLEFYYNFNQFKYDYSILQRTRDWFYKKILAMIKLDAIDKEILELIQQDSRMTIKEMAGKLNRSTTPIFERLKRLEKQGVIQKYVALLDPQKLGKKLHAFIHISIVDHSKKSVDNFVDQISDYSEVMECYHISGDADFLLKLVLTDIEHYNQFVTEKLSTVSNIGRIKSSFSLSVRKKTTAFRVKEN